MATIYLKGRREPIEVSRGDAEKVKKIWNGESTRGEKFQIRNGEYLVSDIKAIEGAGGDKEIWGEKQFGVFEKLPDDCEDIGGGYFLKPAKDQNGDIIKYNGDFVKNKTFDVLNKYGLRTKYSKCKWNKEFREIVPEIDKEAI